MLIRMLGQRASLITSMMLTLAVVACGPGVASDVAPTKVAVSNFPEPEFATNTDGNSKPSASDVVLSDVPQSHFAEPEFSSNTGGNLKPSAYFTRHDLGEELSIEIPNNWHVLSERTVNAIAEQVAINKDVAGISDDTPQTQNLIKANSSRQDPGAILSVSVDVPPTISFTDLSEMTDADLTSVAGEMCGEMDKMLRAGGITMTKFHGARLENFGPYPAIVIEYERKGVLKPGDFIVQINQIAMKSKTVKLTMSYRLEDAVIWKARMARLRKSLVLN